MSVGIIAQRVSIQNEYNTAEQELQDRVLEIYGTSDNEVDLFRPALADSQKIGFFSLDRSSQTEMSEIVDLKEMTEVIQVLLQDVATIRRDITFNKNVMQADYNAKLQQKSLELYCRINERVSELDKLHQERITILRRAFRQQLGNAIAKLAVHYEKDLQEKLKGAQSEEVNKMGTLDEKYREMQSTIQRNESFIQMLQMQLAQYQQNAGLTVSNTTSGDRSSTMDKTREDAVSVRTGGSRSAASVMDFESPQDSAQKDEQVNKLQEELLKMEKKVTNLEEGIEIREEESATLSGEILHLQSLLRKNQVFIDQINHEKDILKRQADEAALLAKRMIDRQKKEMDRVIEEKVSKARKEAYDRAYSKAMSTKHVPTTSEADLAKMLLLEEEKQRLTEQIEQEKAINEERKMEEAKAVALAAAKKHAEAEEVKTKGMEQKMSDEADRLKKEIEKVHRTWEKKFSILQKSMFALKDESYMRQQLQKQAANLHHAAVSYAVDSPTSGQVKVKGRKGGISKKPMVHLPELSKMVVKSGKGNRSLPSGVGEKDYLSYTVSMPSGRQSAAFSVDENQIMSESDQDLVPNVTPLPSPPPANKSEEEHLNASHRVIVVPSVGEVPS